jgi:phospholipase/lecithinase/hemolysin
MQKSHLSLIALLISISTHLLATSDMQLLACYYYDKFDSSQNSSAVHAGLPWVWAKGIAGENIYGRGKEIDGFFEIEELIGCEDGYFGTRTIAHYPNSLEAARELCEDTLIKTFPDEHHNKGIMNMMVKTSFLSFHHLPPFFKETASTANQEISKMIIFGDSLSDQNNLKSWLRILPGAPYFGGRFSNGPNWVDYMHLETGIIMQNWSVGGAVTHLDNDDDARLSTRVAGSVDEEIKRFQEYLEESQDQEGIKDPQSTLFALWSGGNDYLSKLYSKKEINIFINNPDLVINEVTSNIINHVNSLYEIGARKFFVVALPDLGIIPKITELKHYRATENQSEEERLMSLSRKINKITIRHNIELKSKLDSLSAQYPDIKIIFSDVYHGLRNIILSRHVITPQLSFNYNLDPNFIMKLSHGRRPVIIHKACFTGSIWGSDESEDVCITPNRNIFWDSLHPSSFSHTFIALGFHKRLYNSNLIHLPSANNYIQRSRPDLEL